MDKAYKTLGYGDVKVIRHLPQNMVRVWFTETYRIVDVHRLALEAGAVTDDEREPSIRLVSPWHEEITTCSLRGLCSQHEIDFESMVEVIIGSKKGFRGWHLNKNK